MMETFLVLGLCFILYEALDFFQGCIHSNTPSPSDQIEAYRRELDEQRQQQQQEQFLAGLTPLLGAQFAAAAAAAAAAAGSQSTLGSATTPTASTASVISDSYDQESQSQSQSHSQSQSNQNQQHSLSTPGLFRPAALGYYDPEDPLHATNSLPRDYYYLQQQQLKNKVSSRSLLSKFSSTNSDNRIHPEAGAGSGHHHSVLGAAAVITSQPLPAGGEIPSSLFDQPGQAAVVVPPVQLQPSSPLFVELKRAIISQNQRTQPIKYQPRESIEEPQCPQCEEEQIQYLAETLDDLAESEEQQYSPAEVDDDDDEEEEQNGEQEDREEQHSYVGGATSEPDICAATRQQLTRIHHIAIDDIATGQEHHHHHHLSISGQATTLGANSHADFREIECERLRRKCVSVKRIYSISEKF
ncbi:TPR-containing protein DDB_G0280363 isoform X2 [Drosophila santomea]|uniref:TPR-containing protein DDB_G0280363 isoform X2 n=1 Tax=Drosophila santomea TaxID=129105 RepID=UPI0019548914|nr:TPR-containing protein DDB_G0280363 isoform X2 [Drosophila santomea]